MCDDKKLSSSGYGESVPFDSSSASPLSRRKQRLTLRQQSEEGRLLSVVIALVAVVLTSTVIASFLLARKTMFTSGKPASAISIQQQHDVDFLKFDAAHKSRNLDRLKALQIDPSWFSQFLESGLAQDLYDGSTGDNYVGAWLTQLERLDPRIRRRIGTLTDKSWDSSRDRLLDYGLSNLVIENLLTDQFYKFLSLPYMSSQKVAIQLWHAVALQRLVDMPVVVINQCPIKFTSKFIEVPVDGVAIINVDSRLTDKYYLEFLDLRSHQLTVYAYQNGVLKKFSSLQDASSPENKSSSLSQLTLLNNGISTYHFRFTCKRI